MNNDIIFRAVLKTTLLLYAYTFVMLYMPNTHTQQHYLFETFSIKTVAIPKRYRPGFLSYLHFIVHQLCTNDYVQGLQAFLPWKPEFPCYLPYIRSPFAFHFSVLPSAVPLQASIPSPQYSSFFLPVTSSPSILQISQQSSS